MTTTKELRADLESRLKALREQIGDDSASGVMSEQTRLAMVRVDIGTVGIFRHLAEVESALQLKCRALEMANAKLTDHVDRRREAVFIALRGIDDLQGALEMLAGIER